MKIDIVKKKENSFEAISPISILDISFIFALNIIWERMRL